MTAIDPTIRTEGHLDGPQHTEGHLDTPQHAGPSDSGTYLEYATYRYETATEQPPALTMDVGITATIGMGLAARELRGDVQHLASAIRGLERVIADHTATMKAFLAATQQQSGTFGHDESDEALRAIEDAAAQPKVAGG